MQDTGKRCLSSAASTRKENTRKAQNASELKDSNRLTRLRKTKDVARRVVQDNAVRLSLTAVTPTGR
ncbi:hypothetical protein NDU88_001533 [Pleurodeles waltl]|uniref:Uncharacterized protein n=1 Tax=Pleurodeles waltl TaxID=8319 RepID=A0AAV7SCI4_PLEWA|nr:hypothetical protein NDU88_001533 [Pleurodeles waltl]